MKKMNELMAMDAFCYKGYIDTITMKCIVPEWYVESIRKLCDYEAMIERSGWGNEWFTSRDYRTVEGDEQRYLRPPEFTPLGIACKALIEMGIEPEVLFKMGITESDMAIFVPGSEKIRKSSPNQWGENVWKINHKISEYMLKVNRYNEYLHVKNIVMRTEIKNWCEEHGIEIIAE